MNTSSNPPMASDSAVYTDNGVRGAYLPDYSIRPAAPTVAWNTASAITDLDPQTIKEACPACLNPAYECICGGAS